ncbi:MAG: rhodanese family chromate resistance protein ChrE [Burkholderia contaminans]|jgi:rhodanese-related sulfurtransferase|uniref:Rhodanese domain protein n=4 Tax=Burkholderia cepacia complex TaxID=87882 RepID=A4JEF3_BURVG|nr:MULTISPECIES: rhodanese family chromate resistance protein ChrE [Burkholderia]ABO54656.1 Rhodanese domain protein [Burkholderia vietnamiensis G4]HDR9762618.1 rhodanese family chromate resistance protein ChrE [Burkholderia cepacia ATCC 25416]ABO59020.1 Rhodanese domain protein [Burkholderia vietnamiensis G4]ABO59531.1 Rhodanese domain protein [Burkholderia vietnamiensis G4]ABO60350.1 Rhodanese domain protein [Burkholderia vietnamiensis G4]
MTTAIAVSSRDLLAALESNQPPQIVDVRRKSAFNESGKIIIGASWYAPEDVGNWMGDLEQSRTVVVYCAHGQERSQMCAATLAQLGFAASYLEGGFAQWLADGLPVTSHTPGNPS